MVCAYLYTLSFFFSFLFFLFLSFFSFFVVNYISFFFNTFLFIYFLAGSPTPPSNNSKNNITETNNTTKKTSRHTRNSSAGHIPSPAPYSSPISIIPPSNINMQRRRSLDEQSSLQMEGNNNVRTTTRKPTPTPLSSVSARVTSPIPSVRAPVNRNGLTVPKINTVPFPRGGRQIGGTDNHLLRRSASIERRGQVEGKKKKPWTEFFLFIGGYLNHFIHLDPPKKRNLFRFGKKKRKSMRHQFYNCIFNVCVYRFSSCDYNS